MTVGPATQARIDEVVRACEQQGQRAIIVLSGVAGTGKTEIAGRAATAFAGHAFLVKEIQFHPSYSYEEFVEGIRPTTSGGFQVEDGPLLEMNAMAMADHENRYVLLIEEFSRANVNSVLGELMTYVEHRDRSFTTPYSRRQVQIAPNLTLVATMNPRDRSALEVDDALIRRLWIIECPPDIDQLRELLMESLPGNGATPPGSGIIAALVALFEECKAEFPDTFEQLMPFGHGMFAGIRSTDDLAALWNARIKFLLRRPLVSAHPFADKIESLYPWKSTRATGPRQTVLSAYGGPEAGATTDFPPPLLSAAESQAPYEADAAQTHEAPAQPLAQTSSAIAESDASDVEQGRSSAAGATMATEDASQSGGPLTAEPDGGNSPSDHSAPS